MLPWYSNSNYAVLAAIIAKVNGEPYGDFLERHIFKPLGMNASGSGEAFARRERTATAYIRALWITVPQVHNSLDFSYGAGSIVSTVGDMARWDDALMRQTVVSADSFRMMITSGRLNNSRDSTYGMGFVPGVQDGHRFAWHNGLTPNAGGCCLNVIYPDDHIAIIILSNSFNFGGHAEKLESRIFRYLIGKPTL